MQNDENDNKYYPVAASNPLELMLFYITEHNFVLDEENTG